jgi:hypothetical protein
MTRSRRHRLATRTDRPVRLMREQDVLSRAGMVKVQVTVRDFATRVDQTFLILPDRAAVAMLTAYSEIPGQLPRVLKVPVEIRARLS